jgi:uncharacterized membrane protein
MATEELRLVEPPRSNPAGAGVDWIGEGWRLFARAPLMWVISIFVILVIAIVVGIVPLIGSLAFQVVQPVFAAGFMVACRSLETGGDFELEHLFAGFRKNFTGLLIVGLIFLAGSLALLLIFLAFAGFGIVMAYMTGGVNDVYPALMASGMSILLGTLVMLALMVPLLMLYWFAPALVMMHGMAPWAAMKASFRGCLANIVPFIVYGFVMLVLCFVALIPFGLGLLVWFPLAVASTYAAYRAIYTEQAQPAEPAMAKAA